MVEVGRRIVLRDESHGEMLQDLIIYCICCPLFPLQGVCKGPFTLFPFCFSHPLSASRQVCFFVSFSEWTT